MPPYDPSAFPPFAVTVDLVVLTVRRHALCALAVRRGEPPFQGRWALPGGFVRADEDLEAAAARELTEETGLQAQTPAGASPIYGAHLEQLATYGDPKRDPRMRVVSVAHLVLAPDLPAPRAGGDAHSARWAPVETLLEQDDTTREGELAAPSLLTMPGSSVTAWSAPARRSSTPRWPRPSARRSSPSASCAGCTRPSGASRWTPATSTAR
ncbi:NUDIX hydrolase [Streptomyces lydicamycinicus]|nr:NUDIX hydrolase [Streptomyces lydicamycinicus]